MPRSKTYKQSELVSSAMLCFWQHGYYATSINQLVHATGVNRHGLYAEFQDKHGLFMAALDHYVNHIVTPAFSQVETKHAGLDEVRLYFERQIKLALEQGLPGPGCLLANTMTESAPHEAEFKTQVKNHLRRLDKGFANALENTVRNTPKKKLSLKPVDVKKYASYLTIASQGLWAVSRTTDEAKSLYDYVDTLLKPIEHAAK